MVVGGSSNDCLGEVVSSEMTSKDLNLSEAPCSKLLGIPWPLGWVLHPPQPRQPGGCCQELGSWEEAGCGNGMNLTSCTLQLQGQE